MKKFFKGFLVFSEFFVVVLATSSFADSVSALSSNDPMPDALNNRFSQSDIIFYDPRDCLNMPSGGGSLSGPGSWDGTSAAGLADYQTKWVDEYREIAQSLSVEYGIPWETVMAQGLLEGAAGTSGYAQERYNFFGIGAFDSNPDNALTYDSPEDGWRGYYENIRVTETYRSHGVFAGDTITNPYAYAQTIKDAGYATDSDYVDKLSYLIKAIEKRSSEKNWDSSSQLASKHPEMLTNAAKNASGGSSGATGLVSGSANECVKLTSSPDFTTANYQEKLKNLRGFSQHTFGDYNDMELCKSGSTDTVQYSGCGLVSLWAAYYMYSGIGYKDENSFQDFLDAARKDGYNQCNLSSVGNFGSNLGDLLEMNSVSVSGSNDWNSLVAGLEQGNKYLVGTFGSYFTSSSSGHIMMLDHYDRKKDKIYLFDAGMDDGEKTQRCNLPGIECDDSYGIYVDKSAMSNYVSPAGTWKLSYDGCYNDATLGPGSSSGLDYCVDGGGGGSSSSSVLGGSISEGGLTFEQAKIFMMNYGENKNGDTRKYINAVTPGYFEFIANDPECNGDGASNCSSFSVFFANKFSSSSAPSDNGNHLAYSISNASVSTEPAVWTVFSGNKPGYEKWGHTGVILGYHDGEWIVGHSSCSHSGAGRGNGGDGTWASYNGAGVGSGFVIKSSDLRYALWDFGDDLVFAHLSNVNTAAIEDYINGKL